MSTQYFHASRYIVTVMMIEFALAVTAHSQVRHVFKADCLCQNSNGYINAQFYNKPGLGDLKVGDLADISAGTCYDLSVCPEQKALIGTTTIKVNGWTENTWMAYKFDMHGMPTTGTAPRIPPTPPATPTEQGPCPAGFRFIGKLQGYAHDVKIRPSIHVPFSLDGSFQQSPPVGQGGAATSILGTQHIPKGIYIIPSGDVYNYGWAVSDPVLDGNNNFSMYLYCSPGSDIFHQFTQCSVTVAVCGKPGITLPSSRLPLNLAEYCQRRGYAGVSNLDGTGYGWRCVPGDVSIDAFTVCREQYGVDYRPGLASPPPGGPGDWYCEKP